MSWREICATGKKIYHKQIVPGEAERIGAYTQNVLNESRKFAKAIIKPHMKVLDLGSSGEPWFSFLAADNGAKVTAYDIEPPLQPNMLKEKGIEYIQGDIAELPNLGRFDLVFCRNLYPAQFLHDWYDPDFVNFWQALLDMGKSIYWIQMGNGSGKPDTTELHYVNHTREYFSTFFEKLGAKPIVRKYGFTSVEIGVSVLPDISTIPKHDLSNDARALCKWFACQLNNNAIVGSTISLKRGIDVKLVKTILEYNFWLNDYNIIDNGKMHLLSSLGPKHDDYFLIDEQEDRRFTAMFLKMSQNRVGYVAKRALSKLGRRLHT